ncbi:MAG: hypothetical protein R3A80_02195 [Bdellovibrionota bacterium]
MRNWQVSKLLIVGLSLLAFMQCDRFKKKEKKISPFFHVYVPLEDEYSLLKKGLVSIIELSFKSPNIFVEEGLSDRYEIPPFEDWITKADAEAILRLKVEADKLEDLPHIMSFLKRDGGATLPYKATLSSVDLGGSEYRGESVFCRMKIETKDILGKQLCRELVQKLCYRELRAQAKRFSAIAPARCGVNLFLGEEVDTKKVDKERSRIILETGFPLPLRVGGDYPFARYVSVDENLLARLFAPLH